VVRQRGVSEVIEPVDTTSAAATPDLTTMIEDARVAGPALARASGPTWSCDMSLSHLISLAIVLTVGAAMWALTIFVATKII
jgi:hypothetical protein